MEFETLSGAPGPPTGPLIPPDHPLAHLSTDRLVHWCCHYKDEAHRACSICSGEWPTAGCFLSETRIPLTPPVIEPWSSSSSNDDNSHIVNASASTSRKKRKKRKILSRLQTKLNFDECVLTQHKNQQWVTPKVTKILRQCHNGDEVLDSEEQRANNSQPKEPNESVSIVRRTEVAEKPCTETSSSSKGYVEISPGQCSVQELLKRRPFVLSTSCSVETPFEPSASASSLRPELVSCEKSGWKRSSIVVMSSSQESDFYDDQQMEESHKILVSKNDEHNALESSSTQSSPIIKLSKKISRRQRNKITQTHTQRNGITQSPVINRKGRSAQKSKKKVINAEKTAEISILSNADCNIQVPSKNFEFNSSSSQDQIIQLSPVIKSTRVRRNQKLNTSICEASLVVPLAGKTSYDTCRATRNNAKTLMSDSPIIESYSDSVIENTQLSPVIRPVRQRFSKRLKAKDLLSSFIADVEVGSLITTSSSSIGTHNQNVESEGISPYIKVQNKQQNESASKIYHSSPCALTKTSNLTAFNETDRPLTTSPPKLPKSPIIELLSSSKTIRKKSLKKIQRNLADSFLVSETSSESDALSSVVEMKSFEQVPQVNNKAESQSDFIPGTQLCPTVISSRRSTRKKIDTDLKKSLSNNHSLDNYPDPNLSLHHPGPFINQEVSTEKDVSTVPFKDFRVPFSKSSIDTQNPDDYTISVDVETQNLTSPSYCQPVRKSSNWFSSDSNPMNISFGTQDTMDLIVNSLVAKKGNAPDAEAITIDSFSSQDISSETRLTTPVKITTVSDLPSPKSSGYQIATCSSQSTDQMSPVQNEELCINMDSAKKKKRPRKGGYAARLQKLLNRQKSASRIFQHEMLNNSEKFNDKGTKLHVDFMWHEFDKVFLQCNFAAQENKEETALLILDPNQCKNISTNSIINIFPPWHTLTMPENSYKVIMNVFNFQTIASEDKPQNSPPSPTAVVQEFSCKCNDSLPSSAKCTFKLPRNGLEIFEVLFPNYLSLNVPSRQITCTTTENCDGTISELLALPSRASDKHIDICIQRVFHFNDVEKGEICWSVLGQDSKGELSEVILPSRHDAAADYGAIVVGDVYRVGVVNVSKRIHRNKSPGLWAVIDCKTVSAELPASSDLVVLTESECNLKQLYIYVITATNNEGNIMKLDSIFSWARHSWMKPKVSDLHDVINAQHSDCYTVFSFRVKILFVTENILFVTDLSLSNSAQSYCAVVLRPSFYVPAYLASKKCGVALLQDTLFLKGQLSMDRYSRIEMATDQWTAEVVETLSAQKSILAEFSALSAAKDLVSVSGQIIGVDEETAFEWLACVECSGSVLEVTPDGSNLCNVCNKTVVSRPMMSLEILVAVGKIVVKIKLQQSSIIRLLPPSQNDGEGFELASVLGKQIGPLDCLVLLPFTGKEFSFTLEELPSI